MLWTNCNYDISPVGNYGINGDEVGLLKPQVKGLVVRSYVIPLVIGELLKH